jgi:methylglutaconyl-CoA hydratase
MTDYRLENNTAILTLNRPEKRNALSPEVINGFISIFNECDTNPEVKSIIITGNGKAFSAGADLEYLQQLRNNTVGENDLDSSLIAKLILTVYESGKPTIAAVNGPAIAGGCGLATACDFIFADKSNAMFGYSEVRIGFLPAIVSYLLLRRMNEFKARQLLISAEIFGSERALELGLIDFISDDVVKDSIILAEKLNQNSQESIKQTKNLLRTISSLDHKRSIQMAQKYNVISRTTDEFKSGIDQFLNK